MGEGVGLGVGVGEGAGLGVGVGEGAGLGVGVGGSVAGVAVGVGVKVGSGVGVAVGARIHATTTSVSKATRIEMPATVLRIARQYRSRFTRGLSVAAAMVRPQTISYS